MNYPLPSTQDTYRKEIKSIQLMRAIAATSVVYYHIGVLPNFGSFGVDIFFVLSGFVMALIIESGQSPTKFAASRISRIIPMYWLLTMAIFALAAIAPSLLNSTTANTHNFIKSILFIPYFKENGELQPMLGAGWTLNYEILFYFCIWISIVSYRRHYAILTTSLITAAYFIPGLNSSNEVIQAFLGQPFIFEFLIGTVAFYIHTRILKKKEMIWPYFLLATGSYLFMAITEFYGVPINRLWIKGVPSLILLLSFLAMEPFLKTNKSKWLSTIVLIGDASYATYLSHQYIVEGTRKILHKKYNLIDFYSPEGVLLVIATSLVVGHILYKWIDAPLSAWLKRKMINLLPA